MTVIDDYSRFILGWDIKTDMAGGSLTDVVQQAVDCTGMTDVPLEDRRCFSPIMEQGTFLSSSTNT